MPREDWNALLAPDDSPFLDWDWLWAMEESKSAARNTGWSPCHLVVRIGPERKIAAACPLYLKSHSQGEFVFDHGWADAAERAGISYFPKLLVGVPFTPHTGRRFHCRARIRSRADDPGARPRAAAIVRRQQALVGPRQFLRDGRSRGAGDLGFAERLGYQYHWLNAGFATFDDYLAQLKSKRRYAVRHERAALAGQGVEIRALAGDEIPDALFGPMYKIYLSTLEKLYWGRQYLTREFFNLMRDHFKRNLCFVCAYRGPELIAGTFNLEKSGVLYGRYWGAFEELKFLHFNVCYYAAIDHCIERGVQRFEPGAGGEYKWLRGFNPALTRSMHYLAHRGLAQSGGQFPDARTPRRRSVDRRRSGAGQLKAPPPPTSKPNRPKISPALSATCLEALRESQSPIRPREARAATLSIGSNSFRSRLARDT